MHFDNTMNRHTQTLLPTVLCKRFPITTIGNLILISHGRSTFGCSSLAGNKGWVHAEAAAMHIYHVITTRACLTHIVRAGACTHKTQYTIFVWVTWYL